MPSRLLLPIIWKMTLISIPPMWKAPTSQASPEFFGCCWGLIVGPGAGSVGHRLIATLITLAKEVVSVQHSSLRFISAPAVDSVATLF